MAQKIVVLGAGAWGTALAVTLAHNGNDVLLWCYEDDVANEINTQHRNSRYAHDVVLPAAIRATTNLVEACADADIIFEAIPVMHMRTTLEQIPDAVRAQKQWVITSKGIEVASKKLPSEILVDLGISITNMVVCAGPTFARELMRGDLTGFVVAGESVELRDTIEKLLANAHVLVDQSTDMIGVQLGGALKNIVALGVGILQGAGYHENARALAIATGLQELAWYAQKRGAHPLTIYGRAGVGDLLLTAMSSLSKNTTTGMLRGQGLSPVEIEKKVGTLPEGCNTVKALFAADQALIGAMPFCAAVGDVFWGDALPAHLVTVLRSSEK
jgi:glycerol-3-phosphate dehydrogenase (NAD(P)+)